MAVYRWQPSARRNPAQFLCDFGPRIPVALAASNADRQRQVAETGAERPAVVGPALVDPGADYSLVEAWVATEIGSHAIGSVHVIGAGVERGLDVAKHEIVFEFPWTGLLVVSSGMVSAVPTLRNGAIAVLGRDVLTQFALTYDGRTGTFTMSDDPPTTA